MAGTAAKKLRAGRARFVEAGRVGESSREVFIASCGKIAASLRADGFSYAQSGPRLARKIGDFTTRVSFHTSPLNVSGELVELWIQANVYSRRLALWRAAQPRPLRTDDAVTGGQLGNLLPQASWMEWNLAHHATREEQITDAVTTIRQIAFPFFAQFEDVSALCSRLVKSDLPSFEMPVPIEFLLCFAGRTEAEVCLHRFLQQHPDIQAEFRDELKRVRKSGLPEARHSGHAVVLAYATYAYDLTPRK